MNRPKAQIEEVKAENWRLWQLIEALLLPGADGRRLEDREVEYWRLVAAHLESENQVLRARLGLDRD